MSDDSLVVGQRRHNRVPRDLLVSPIELDLPVLEHDERSQLLALCCHHFTEGLMHATVE